MTRPIAILTLWLLLICWLLIGVGVTGGDAAAPVLAYAHRVHDEQWETRLLDVTTSVTFTVAVGTQAGDLLFTPAQWSADGTRLALTTGVGRVGYIDVFDTQLGDTIRITAGDGGWNTSPHWSPDGDWLVYESLGTIYQRNVARYASSNRDLDRWPNLIPQARALPGFDLGLMPRYAPDGSSLAVVGTVSETDLTLELVSYDAVTETIDTLTDGYHINDDYRWSPDGTRIVFTAPRLPRPLSRFAPLPTDPQTIYVLDVESREVTTLTAPDARNYEPDWSPDGTQIAFISERDGNPEVYVMAADGTNPRRLTATPYPESHPAWSPDGAWIAAVSAPFQVPRLVAVPVDGGAAVRLVDDEWVWQPSWRP